MALPTRPKASGVLSVGVVACWFALGAAGEQGGAPHLSRPPDIPIERLDRPRPEQDRPMLGQSEAVALAKAAAKQELGSSFDVYALKAAVFDSTGNFWSITFSPKQGHILSARCLVVFVHADTRATDVRRCS